MAVPDHPALSSASTATSGAPSGGAAADSTIPFSRRPLDIILVAFFVINLAFIAYMVDLEQVVVANPFHFQYPIWPPALVVDLVHAYGRAFDPLVMARPVWWKAAIWIEVLFFGPFYPFAIYAYIKGKNWIRVPSIIWASSLLTNITIVLSEEGLGQHASPHFGIVLAINLAWVLMPILALIRMAGAERPFTAAPSARDEHLGGM